MLQAFQGDVNTLVVQGNPYQTALFDAPRWRWFSIGSANDVPEPTELPLARSNGWGAFNVDERFLLPFQETDGTTTLYAVGDNKPEVAGRLPGKVQSIARTN